MANKVVIGSAAALVAIALVVISVTVYISQRTQYGIVLDAGSSGTRAHVFSWSRRSTETAAVVLQEGGPGASVNPGISSFANNLTGLNASLAPLIEYAKNNVPSRWHTWTPIYLRATAGMRLLPVSEQNAILEVVRDILAASDFQFSADQASVIPGSDEGLYGWLTVNYLSDSLTANMLDTHGALDLGGASVQITFVPESPPPPSAGNVTEKVTISGVTYAPYTHSYLGWGRDQAENAFDAILAANASDGAAVWDACIPTGYNTTTASGNGSGNVTLVGASSMGGCEQAVRGMVQAAASAGNCSFPASECGLDGVYQPPPRGPFFAFSSFAYLTSFFNLGETPTLGDIRNATATFCLKDWDALVKEYPDEGVRSFLPEYCFNGWYILALLEDGFNFLPNTTALSYVSTIDGVDVGWALGAMLKEANLLPFDDYGSSRLVTFWYGIAIAVTAVLILVIALIVLLRECMGGKTASRRVNGQGGKYNPIPEKDP